MPLEPNPTKNHVDLNQIDASTLTLVERGELLDDLTSRLRTVIRDTFSEGIEMAESELGSSGRGGGGASTVSGAGYSDHPGPNGGSTPSPRVAAGGGGGNPPNNPPRPPKGPKKLTPEQEFEKLRKLEASTRKVIEKLGDIQKKKNKDDRSKSLLGNTYSSAGKKFAGGIDEIATYYHDYSAKELDEAKQKLSDIQEGIRFSTVGKENKLLTDATIRLQDEIARETKKRGTFLGKIGETMTKSNINIASVLLGFTSHSPLMGMMTKYWLDTIHDFKEEREQKRAKQFQIGDIKDKLPRPDEPIDDNSPVKLDDETLRNHLGSVNDPDVRQATLENLLNKGQITLDQHQNLSAEMLPPGHQPLWERLGGATTPGAQPPTLPGQPPPLPGAQSPTQVTQQSSTSPTPVHPDQVPLNVLRDHLGNPVRDHQAYTLNTPKKQQKQDQIDAMVAMMNDDFIKNEQKKHDEKMATATKPENWDEDLFGPWDAEPTALTYMKKRQAERVKNPWNNPIPYATVDGAPPVYENLARPTDAPVQQNQNPNAPERVAKPEETVASLTNLLKATHGVEEKEEQKLELLADEDKGPFSNLQRLDEQQLEELKKINTYLEKQIEQADLAADAARRETGEDGDTAVGADMGNKKKKGGGLFAGLMESVLGGGLTGMVGKYFKKVLGIGGAAEGGAAGGAGKMGWIKRLFGGGKAAEGVEVAGGAARGVAGAEEAVAGGGLFSKLGKGLKGLGKMGGVGKLLGKLALPLTIIMGIIDFFNGFVNAEEFLGLGKKLTIMDRVAGGIGGVVKGLVGIVDFIFELFGVKTNIGGILGKGVAKIFSSFFKLLGSFFNVLMKIFKPVMKILGPIIEFLAGQLGELLESLAEIIEGIANFIEGFVDVTTAFLEDDPVEAMRKGLELIWNGVKGIFTAIGKILFKLTGLEFLSAVIEKFKQSFVNLFDNIGKMVGVLTQFMLHPFDSMKDIFMKGFQAVEQKLKDWFSSDTLNWLSETLDSIKKFITDPIGAIKKKFFGDDTPPPPSPKAPGLPKGYNEKTGQIEPEKTGPFHMPTWRTGNYDEKQSDQPAPPELSTPPPTPTKVPAPVATTPPPATPPPTPELPPAPPVVSPTIKPSPMPTNTPLPAPPPPPNEIAKKTDALHQSPSIASRVGGGISTAVGTGLGVTQGMNPLRLGRDQMRNVDLLRRELTDQGMNDKQIAAVLGNVGKESNFTVNTEGMMGGKAVYYSRARAEEVFGKERLDKLGVTDSDLKSHESFYNKIYGANDRVGRGMGNLQEGDGYRFRGRGYIQLTGRNNYAQASKEIFGDDRLVKNPDLVSDPSIAAKVTSWYIGKHGKTMASKMGVDLQSGSQEDINLAYTSAIAGRQIKRGSGYLGGKDIIGKVDNYAAKFAGPQQTGAGAPVMASVRPPMPTPVPNPAVMAAALPPPVNTSSGMVLAQATSQNSSLLRAANNKPAPTSTVISQPNTSITTNNTTISHNMRAKNTDTSYERLMGQNAVAT